MKKNTALFYRLAICFTILLVDLVVFFLPLTALFLIYILLFNPPWFRGYLNRLTAVNAKNGDDEEYKDYFLGP